MPTAGRRQAGAEPVLQACACHMPRGPGPVSVLRKNGRMSYPAPLSLHHCRLPQQRALLWVGRVSADAAVGLVSPPSVSESRSVVSNSLQPHGL